MARPHRTELSESVSGESPVTYRRTPRTFRPGRTCAATGCPTVLSIYNGGKWCAVHSSIGKVAAPAAVPVDAEGAVRRRAS
jgi:hypothetical protein